MEPNTLPVMKLAVDDDDDDSGGEEEGKIYGGGEFGLNKKKKLVLAGGSGKNESGGGGGGGGGGGVSPPRCQAEKCAADLMAAKRYHRRHKVCESHAKASAVVVAGVRQRFCQQCSRFHVLSEFDDTKRSCRKRLAGHNERRRKSSSESNGEGSSHQRSTLQLNENQPGQAAGRGRTLITLPGDPTYKQFHVR
ncbi:hypothetical protein RHGRI_018398 [Rhododendron griersonianum]|uniref:SBP-type domain-containing protein n=1 Tax=Rhododendron griersonianum TaxID=479676 RepID=A0AAV6K1B1_9ERIC|nr:hypothetical protein RHGRI_018398 [Rhododendron griersonianum]